jgi:hypothetical protein
MGKIKRDGISKSLKWTVLDRDNYTCRYCGARGVPMEIDHVFPESRGGPTVQENLVTACEPCNRAKRDRLGFYPLPPYYLDKMREFQTIIDWYRDYQEKRIKSKVDGVMTQFNAEMDKELSRLEAAFRVRHLVFRLIKSFHSIGLFLIISAGLWLFVQIHLTNTGRMAPSLWMLAPYGIMFSSLVLLPAQRLALNWYMGWNYPIDRYAGVEKRFVEKALMIKEEDHGF